MSKFSRGDFVQLGNITMMKGRVIEVKPGFFGKQTKYKVRMLFRDGSVRMYKENQLKLAKKQEWDTWR